MLYGRLLLQRKREIHAPNIHDDFDLKLLPTTHHITKPVYIFTYACFNSINSNCGVALAGVVALNLLHFVLFLIVLSQNREESKIGTSGGDIDGKTALLC